MTGLRAYRRVILGAVVCVLTAFGPRAPAQQETSGGEPLTREEFARFLEEYQQFKAEVAHLHEENIQLKKQLAELKTDT